MLSTKLSNARAILSRFSSRQLTPQHLSSTRMTLRSTFRQPCLRTYAKPPSSQNGASAARQAARIASEKAAGVTKDKDAISTPKTLLIFHSGTTRTTFLAMLKVTSLFVGAFFVGIITPTYVRSDKSLVEVSKVAACGLGAPLLMAYITAPFVTHMRVKLPASAMSSAASLEKFIRGGGNLKDVELYITTMSVIAKPRTTAVQLGELQPAKQRLGLINYIRQHNPRLEEQQKARRWYQFRPVTNFYVQPGRPAQARKGRYADTRKDPVEWWVWEDLQKQIPAASSS